MYKHKLDGEELDVIRLLFLYKIYGTFIFIFIFFLRSCYYV